jgi:hypothetical protein
MRLSNEADDFRSWHFSDVAGLTDDVRSWGQSGLTADIAETTRLTQLGLCGISPQCPLLGESKMLGVNTGRIGTERKAISIFGQVTS